MGDQRFLVSDIGGTNIRLAWFQDDPHRRNDEALYRVNPGTGKPYSIHEAFEDYLSKVKQSFSAACLGLAGRVQDGCVQITNRPDIVYRKEIASLLHLDESRVLLVNDMPPHLAGVDLLLPSQLVEIRAGKTDPHGARALLMPGTGVGVGASVYSAGLIYRPFPSEGGHLDFSPRDDEQDQLLKFLRPFAVQARMNHVSNEFVFAGEGLRRIYTFLQNSNATDFDAAPKSEEITIAAAGELPADDLRLRTVKLYMKLIGAAAGNLALLFTATGGVYLGGSICLSLRKFLSQPVFMDAFLSSGPQTHRDLLEEMPIRLIDYKDSGLLGAGYLAMSLID